MEICYNGNNDRGDTMDVLTIEKQKRKMIPLDDLNVRFFEEIEKLTVEPKKEVKEQSSKTEHEFVKPTLQVNHDTSKSIPDLTLEETNVLRDCVGNLENTGEINEVAATISSLENSLNSLTPKVPIIPEKKLEKLKENAKMKLLKKNVREELKDVHYDKNPELANLENTIILNADILKKDMTYEKIDKDDEKKNKRSKLIILSLFVILILFACSIPFIIQFM